MGKIPKSLIACILLGLVLRVLNIDQSFWLDEASQAQMSSMTISDIWFNRDGDFHPPLYYFISHIALMFTTQESMLRMTSVIPGTILIYVIFLIAKTLGLNNKAIKYVCLFTAINPFLVYYSQEFRAYSLMVLLCSTAFLFAIKRNHLLASIFGTLALYTHYSSIFYLLFHYLYFRSSARYLVLLIGIFSLWIPQMLSQLSGGLGIDHLFPGWRSVLTLEPAKAFPILLFKFVAGRIDIENETLYLIYSAIVIVITLVAIFISRTNNSKLILWLWIPAIIMLASSYLLPQFQPFRLIYSLPPLIIMISIASAKYPKLFATIFIYISIFGLAMQYSRPRLQKENWREAIEYINNTNIPVIVKFPGKFSPMDWYGVKVDVIPADSKIPIRENSIEKIVNTLPSELLVMEYLTGLTDSKFLVEKELIDAGYSEYNIQNFEGVGFIKKYYRYNSSE